jgi:hypothetical protein
VVTGMGLGVPRFMSASGLLPPLRPGSKVELVNANSAALLGAGGRVGVGVGVGVGWGASGGGSGRCGQLSVRMQSGGLEGDGRGVGAGSSCRENAPTTKPAMSEVRLKELQV